MRTTSLGIENLCVPCHAHCRYCLLSSCGKADGVDYERGKRLAERLLDEAKQMRPDLNVYYYIGYCMDDERLLDYIRFSQEYGSPSAHFLQLNGLRLRNEKGIEEFVHSIYDAGIETIDLTFYGTKEYHDRFAGRPGDFKFLIDILKSAKSVGLKIHCSCPIHKENIGQMDELLDTLDPLCSSDVSVFIPHGKGRGLCLDPLRLTLDDYEKLSENVKAHIGTFRTEKGWIASEYCEESESRVLTLVLKQDNIDLFEQMTLPEIIRYLEELDDRYYETIPSVSELMHQYGRREGTRLYRRFRDLHLEWQRKHLDQCGEDIWDMNDETHHFSIRV